ncbi:MAG: Gfo/Idh/MocA family oxidoreductase [candidate division WS1 bacterium]|nr:Gfo/Idh/MocA family oxidoreductase [candidate division WS1 bacterium]
MPRTLRLGFIGSGGMTVTHTTAMAGFKNIQFAAFCDVKKAKAAVFAEKYAAEAFTDPGKMLAQAELDAVWINLPPFAHGEAEMACLEHQVPFLIEKPINKDLRQAAKIAAAVEKAGLLTCVGYLNRYQPSVEAARKLLLQDPGIYANGGWLGAPPRSGDPEGIWGWWIQKDKSGGQFVEQVTHTIDLARYLLGDAESVTAYAARGFVKGIKNYTNDDALAASVKFKSGAVANFFASCSAGAGGGVYLHVYALNTGIRLIGWSHDAEIWQAGKKRPKRVASKPNAFALEDAAFLKAVRTGDPAGIKTTYADGLKTLELTLAATQSAEKNGKTMALKY